MLETWRLMWSNEDRGTSEPRTPYVMALLAVASIAIGSLMNWGFI